MATVRKIKKLMIDKNINLKELAELTGYSYQTLRNYMSKGLSAEAESKIKDALKKIYGGKHNEKIIKCNRKSKHEKRGYSAYKQKNYCYEQDRSTSCNTVLFRL